MSVSRRHHRSHWLLAPAVALVLSGCAGDGGVQQVGPVEVEVPSGWEATDPDVEEDLVAAQAWRSASGEGMSLQVFVGCGESDADELTIEAASRARAPLTLIDIEDGVSAEVAGLDAARRTTMTFRADGSEAASARLAGLYGTAARTLVVVELSSPTRSYSATLADEILASIRAESAAAVCS
ncbi:MAG: hypothetical protein JJT89_12255 [Nitriliruptoraceae bacterium]|nr:hypothetical protein [Nitriliruptoraceae bacterium]